MMFDADFTFLADWYATPAGRRAARLLAARLAPIIQGSATNRLLALGFPAPVLMRVERQTHERRIVVTGAPATCWPTLTPNATCVADPLRLPFAEALFDDVLLIHALEVAERPAPLLRELWRVMAPAGRLIVIVPNRNGVWAQFERTPFGHGHPYSGTRLAQLLSDTMFEIEATTNALFAPPLARLGWLEAPLRRIAPRFGGVRIVAARKTDGMGAAPIGAVDATQTVAAGSPT
jgi:SAM-dependent methyltransferase